jgi:hypothetical protein
MMDRFDALMEHTGVAWATLLAAIAFGVIIAIIVGAA